MTATEKSTIKRMKNYIAKEALSNARYGLTYAEWEAITGIIASGEKSLFFITALAFNYGRAKGLREAKAGVKQ